MEIIEQPDLNDKISDDSDVYSEQNQFFSE